MVRGVTLRDRPTADGPPDRVQRLTKPADSTYCPPRTGPERRVDNVP
jgi:hypothetical protein